LWIAPRRNDFGRRGDRFQGAEISAPFFYVSSAAVCGKIGFRVFPDWFGLSPAFAVAGQPKSGGRKISCCSAGEPVFYMNSLYTSRWLPVVLLFGSNIFMTFAWYGHLKFKNKPLFAVILVSWGIAFFEYILQVPANRWGSSVYSATQLKIIQEVVTLTVFVGFAIFYLGERIRWNHVAAFVCILAAVAFTFLPRE
jgi:uncharacterized protein (DUF486 family)